MYIYIYMYIVAHHLCMLTWDVLLCLLGFSRNWGILTRMDGNIKDKFPKWKHVLKILPMRLQTRGNRIRLHDHWGRANPISQIIPWCEQHSQNNLLDVTGICKLCLGSNSVVYIALTILGTKYALLLELLTKSKADAEAKRQST